MNWNGKSVLVTGAGGFIGSHLVERLVTAGAKVRAFIRYTSRGDVGNLAHVPKQVFGSLELVRGDLRDVEAVRGAAKGVDTIFHLGALIAIPYSYVNPREVAEVNMMGTFNVLAAARSEGVRRLVHTSTSEVFGTARYVPIDEAHPLQGQSPYSASKIGADKLAESFFRSFDTPVVTVRPFNTYGPRQSARAIIPTIISQALTRDEVKLGSLDPSRDLLFCTDTAEGFVKAASADAALGHEINLGTGVGVTIGELAQRIFKIVGKSPKITTDTQRVRPEKSEVLRLLAANAKAKDLLGWTPTVALDDGLAKTVAWVKDHLHLFRPDEYTV
ncbi:MAG: SDR family NAD(P)-dependent oxidoreductase [Myxococcaceae bacterium]